MRCGIEFEYLLVDTDGPEPGRIRDFSNLPFAYIRDLLEEKPGREDKALATGDLGIRSGYWYLEGDVRFHGDGCFHTLAVKGVEIRTPPAPCVRLAIQQLLEIESQLSATLARQGLGLAIAGFNPIRSRYDFDPPLNAWELKFRRACRGYDGAQVSTLSYGPDINLSMPGWTPGQSLAATRRLNAYSPYIVPFSFSSPFASGGLWPNWSKRTFERAGLRPAVNLFLAAEDLVDMASGSQLVYPARQPSEAGRIEFKAFDAMPLLELLTACCHLLVGVCLADDLPDCGEGTDLTLYQRAVVHGFNDEAIHAGSQEVLAKAKAALLLAGDSEAAALLAPLENLLLARRTPAHDLLDAYRQTGLMFKPGGYAPDAQQLKLVIPAPGRYGDVC